MPTLFINNIPVLLHTVFDMQFSTNFTLLFYPSDTILISFI